MSKGRGIGGLFILGLMVVVLLIIAGIISGLILLPVVILGYVLGLNEAPSAQLLFGGLSLIVGIIMIGWTFLRFNVTRKR